MKKHYIVLLDIVVFTLLIAIPVLAKEPKVEINLLSKPYANTPVKIEIKATSLPINKGDEILIDFGPMIKMGGCRSIFDVKFNNKLLTFWGFDETRTKSTFFSPETTDNFTITVEGHNDPNFNYYNLYYDSYGYKDFSVTFARLYTYSAQFKIWKYDLSSTTIKMTNANILKDNTITIYIPVKNITGTISLDDTFQASPQQFSTYTRDHVTFFVKNPLIVFPHTVTIQPTENKKPIDFPTTITFSLSIGEPFTKYTIKGKTQNNYYIEYPQVTFETLQDATIKWGYNKEQMSNTAKNGDTITIEKVPVYFQAFEEESFPIEKIQVIDNIKIDAEPIKIYLEYPTVTNKKSISIKVETNIKNAKKYLEAFGTSKEIYSQATVNLIEGKNTFYIKVVTESKREKLESFSVELDSTPPKITFKTPQGTYLQKVNIQFTPSEKVKDPLLSSGRYLGNNTIEIPSNKNVTVTFYDFAGNYSKYYLFVKRLMSVTIDFSSKKYLVNENEINNLPQPINYKNVWYIPIKILKNIPDFHITYFKNKSDNIIQISFKKYTTTINATKNTYTINKKTNTLLDQIIEKDGVYYISTRDIKIAIPYLLYSENANTLTIMEPLQ